MSFLWGGNESLACVNGTSVVNGTNTTTSVDNALRMSLIGVTMGILILLTLFYCFLFPAYKDHIRGSPYLLFFLFEYLDYVLLGASFKESSFGNDATDIRLSNEAIAVLTGTICLGNPFRHTILLAYLLYVLRSDPERVPTSRRCWMCRMIVIFLFFWALFMSLSYSIGNSDSQLGCFFIVTGWYDSEANTRIHH